MHSSTLLQPLSSSCSKNTHLHCLVCTGLLLHCAPTSSPFCSEHYTSTHSGASMFTPLLCSNLLHPPAPKNTHLHYLVHSCTFLHHALTSCTLLLQKIHIYTTWCVLVHSSTVLQPPTPFCSEKYTSPLSGAFMHIPPLCSNLLHPPAPKNTHFHYLVCTGSLLRCALTSCSLLLRNFHISVVWCIHAHSSTVLQLPAPKITHLHCLVCIG
jgi:hypothetical protein